MIDRIRELIAYYGLNATTFADRVGVTRASMSHLFSGRNQPSLDFVCKVRNTFPDVSTDWIIFGRGEMFGLANESKGEHGAPPPQIQPKIQNPPTLTLFDFQEKTDGTPLQSIISDEKQTEKPLSESKIQTPPVPQSRILDSKEDKKLQKLIFIYSDNTFEILKPTE